MTNITMTPTDPKHAPPTTDARKPYQKPEVRYERVFETMALSCGKVGGSQAACHFVRKTS